MKNKLITICLLVFISSCSIFKTTKTDDAVLYQKAIEDAIYPKLSEIDTNLTAINEQNPNLVWKTINNEKYILAIAWKQYIDYYKNKLGTYYNTDSFPIWVTIAPDLKQRFKNESVSDTNMRLKQLLGLPPTATYNYFVEFWVKPSDLFRPCPDKEINDKKCETCFPPNVETEHENWINKFRINSFYDCNLFYQYPWTQLGYTYDWNPKNKSHIGLSEFVIGKNKNIIVNKIYTTSEYLKK